IYAFLTMGAVELLTHLTGLDAERLPQIIIFVILWGIAYAGIFFGFNYGSPELKGGNLLCNINK
ncbi:MAG: hypothetical protein K2J39_04930, partial [Ruminococcus sp.]|nr:hypothetical protein [Ruminococcus sp.]